MDFGAKRVLVCLRYGIGDVVMELPVLSALRAALPGARIAALGAEPATQLLEGDDRVDEVVAVSRWGLSHRWDTGTAETRAGFAAWWRERRFDLHLDVHHAAPPIGEVVWPRGVRSLEAAEWAEAEAVRAGMDGVEAVKAAVEEGWGLRVPPALRPELCPSRQEQVYATTFLRERGIEGDAPIAISPVASLSLKRWPLESFAALADRLSAETGRPILVFCGPQQEVGNALMARMRAGRPIVRVGALHLRLVAALLARCALLVCNDTGLMHMAAALGVPTVAIFGPTAPRVYLPAAAHALAAGGEDIACPHRNTDSLQPPGCWADDRCLIGIGGCIRRTGVEEVLDLARRALAGERRRLAVARLAPLSVA